MILPQKREKISFLKTYKKRFDEMMKDKEQKPPTQRKEMILILYT